MSLIKALDPVCYLSQGDTGRCFYATVVEIHNGDRASIRHVDERRLQIIRTSRLMLVSKLPCKTYRGFKNDETPALT